MFRDYNDFQMWPWPKDAAADDVPVELKNAMRIMMDLQTTAKKAKTAENRIYQEEVRDAYREGGTPR